MTKAIPTVVKVGGSVLPDEVAYRAAAQRLARLLEGRDVWAVASAAGGVTDSLLRLGDGARDEEVQGLIDLQSTLSGGYRAPSLEAELRNALAEARSGSNRRLLAWGEQASVSALRARLLDEGLDLPVVEMTVQPRLPDWASALVPGFFLRGPAGEIHCLPRGGSDISAVILAHRLGADCVRFWKNGGGIRTEDRRVLPTMRATELLSRVEGTIRPIHPIALRLAVRFRINLVLEDPLGNAGSTHVLARAEANDLSVGAPPAEPEWLDGPSVPFGAIP